LLAVKIPSILADLANKYQPVKLKSFVYKDDADVQLKKTPQKEKAEPKETEEKPQNRQIHTNIEFDEEYQEKEGEEDVVIHGSFKDR